MKLTELRSKTVAIWGYGVEGRATCDYLQEKLPELTLSVLCPEPEVDARAVKFIHDEVDADLLDRFDVVIKSPGISPYQDAVKASGCQVISSSALWFANERQGTVIAVTGTKGKSTTCAMLAQVLKAMGHEVVLAGNFGMPLISISGAYDYVVLESSSYQAQDGAIQADLAVLLNLYPEHLDWHGSERQYQRDKWCLMEQASQVVLNAEDKGTQAWQKSHPVNQVGTFATQHGFYVLKGVLMYQDRALLSGHGWALQGEHNLLNAAAVCEVVNRLGLNIMNAMNAIKAFQPLPHRLQSVTLASGVIAINDSIASTPHATWAALKTVPLDRTWLLVGGHDRGVDWQWWAGAVAQKPLKGIMCSGENGKKIHQLLLNQGIQSPCLWQPSLKQAVQSVKQKVVEGDVILLSPGAPSFDAFKNYQERGDQFILWLNS